MKWQLNIQKPINRINHINGPQEKNYMIISIDKENPKRLHDKSIKDNGTGGNILQHYS